MDIFGITYLKIIFENVCESSINVIDSLASPFKELLTNLKESMEKAKDAPLENLDKINKEVNIWRDELTKKFVKYIPLLSQDEIAKIDDLMFNLVRSYTDYMGGVNTGYKSSI